MREASIFNIQRFSTNDGPGIRTTVFLKGCPLNCAWCPNPEGIAGVSQLVIDQNKCIECGACTIVCPGRENEVCILCGSCVAVCPAEARQIMGRTVRAVDLLADIEKDRVFFDESGGGVTFSGGEPLAQPGFLSEILRLCQRAGIHSAVDTSGFAPWPVLAETAALADLILYDIKHVDDEKHVRLTGVSNALILTNLRRLKEAKTRIWLRMPVIPGLNDDAGNIDGTARLALELGINEIYLLPYHNTGGYKYGRLGLECTLPEIEPPSGEHMENLAKMFSNLGIHAIIGG